MSWIVERATDNGKANYYRFHVTGTNTECVPSESFSWSVGGLGDERYVLAPEVNEETRKAFAEGKKVAP